MFHIVSSAYLGAVVDITMRAIGLVLSAGLLVFGTAITVVVLRAAFGRKPPRI